MGVTLNIVAETLFGADVSHSARDVGVILSDLMEEFGRIVGLAAMFQPPLWVPTPINRHFKKATRMSAGIATALIQWGFLERRAYRDA